MGLSVGRLSKPRPLPNSYSGAPQSLPHRPRYTARQEGRGGGGGGGGGGCVYVLGREMDKSTFNSKQNGHFLCVYIATPAERGARMSQDFFFIIFFFLFVSLFDCLLEGKGDSEQQ